MKTLTGTFESSAQAEDAVRALQDAGIASGDISLEDKDEDGGGWTLVTARVDDAQLDAAAAILNQDGVVEERRTDPEDSAPSNFDASDPRSYRREDEPDSSVIIPPLPR